MKKRTKKRAFLLFATLFLFLIGSVGIFFRNLQPAFSIYVGLNVRNYYISVLNEAFDSLCKQYETELQTLAVREYDSTGKIAAIRINSVLLNRIASEMISAGNIIFSESTSQDFSLPLGSVMGSALLSGRGPRIGVRILPIGNVNGSTESHFESAGINQTIHRIDLSLAVKFNAAIPFYTQDEKISLTFCVSEIILIGEIPQVYFNPSP